MATGCCNIYTSRRTEFDECYYWKRNDKEKDLDDYVHENQYTGKFYAKEITPMMKKKNIISGVFMFDSSSITLKTSDNVDIDAGDIVKYEDKYWTVVDVQEVEIHKNTQFMKQVDYRTYIQLRG